MIIELTCVLQIIGTVDNKNTRICVKPDGNVIITGSQNLSKDSEMFWHELAKTYGYVCMYNKGL